MAYFSAYSVMPFGKSTPMPRRVSQGDGDLHKPPGPPKSCGADIATLIELLEAGRL